MLNYEEGFVNKFINKLGGLAPVNESVRLLCDYVTDQHKYYDSKHKRINKWDPDVGELYEFTIAVFTICLVHVNTTYQAIIGMIANRIGNLDNQIDQCKCAAEIIAVISKSGLISINKRGPGRSIMVTTKYRLNKEIPVLDKHMPYFQEPLPVTENRDPNHGNILLGGIVKSHNDEICLDHINRMNKIPLKLNTNLLCLHEEAPKSSLNTTKKKEQWNGFITGSYDSYTKIVRKGNKFWIDHKYDVRGRTYTMNYYVSPQGSSFKKAIIQLAKTEIVKR